MKGIRFAGKIITAFFIPVVFACGPGESPALPPVGFRVEFGEHNIPTEMAVGQRVFADVSVKNISARTWPNKPNREGLNAVNLSYHWINRKGRVAVFDGLRTPLPHDLNPGETVQLRAVIEAPNKGGKYVLEVTLVQEGVAWFPEEGGAKLVIPVNVALGQTEPPAVTGHEPRSAVDIPRMPNTKSLRSERGGNTPLVQEHATKLLMGERQNQPLIVQSDKVTDERDKGRQPWSVQVGSYPEENEAQALAKRLADNGLDAYVATVQLKGKSWYRVRVGRLASITEAEKLKKTLAGPKGFKQAFIAKR